MQHYGNAVAENLTLTENFDTVFGTGKHLVTGIELVSGPSTMLLNGAFNGNSDTEMIAANSSLAPDESAQIRVTLALTGAFGLYENQAELSYDSGGNRVTNVSTAGTDPDPDGDGDPTNNSDPTFVEVATGQLHGFHYIDHDDDGVFDPDERGIPGVVVTLTGTDIHGDPVEMVETTMGDGGYWFMGLLPGDYSVTQTHPDGFMDGQETPGNFGGTAENDVINVSLVNQGPFIAEDYNFGEVGFDPSAHGKDPFLASSQGDEVEVQRPVNPNDIVPVRETPLEVVGNRLTVHGTPQADWIRIMAHDQSHRIIVNSVEYFVPSDDITQIDVQSSAGNDTIEIRGTQGPDTLTFTSASTAKLEGNGYTIDVEGSRTINAYGGGGQDAVIFADSAGRDEFLANSKFAQMSNATFTHTARHFESVTATSTTGADRATLHGTEGDDRLVAGPDQSSLKSAGFEAIVNGFTTVRAYAKDGNDTAIMRDSAGDNILASHPHTTNLRGDGINLTANDFDSVVVESSGGSDVAYLHGSDGNDDFVGRPNDSEMVGNGFKNRAVGFGQTIVYAHGGTNDEANLYDSKGHDVAVARPKSTVLRGSGFKNTVRGFDQVTSHSVQGGNDVATFVDSKGDDRFVGRANSAELTGDGFKNFANGFGTVVVHSQAGGEDTAKLMDSVGDDVFVSRNDKAVMRAVDSSYKTIANGFDNVHAHSTSGNDAAIFLDVESNEVVHGHDDSARVNGGRNHRTDGFNRVTAKTKEGQQARSEVDSVDYIFSQLGDWR